MSDKQERQAALEVRLLIGFTRIGEVLNRGAEVTNWQRHWLDLLAQFEAIDGERRREVMPNDAA